MFKYFKRLAALFLVWFGLGSAISLLHLITGTDVIESIKVGLIITASVALFCLFIYLFLLTGSFVQKTFDDWSKDE